MKPSLSGLMAAVLILLLSMWFAGPAFGRNGSAPRTRQGVGKPLRDVAERVLTPVNADERLKEDKERPSSPQRFAIPEAVQITPQIHGTWEEVPGGRLWRMRFHSRGATDLNFAFTTFWLPEGATLHISSLEEDYFQGPYTARDNKPHEQLWTPVIPGSSAVMELFVPEDAKAQPRLVLSQVNAGYRDMFGRGKAGGEIAEAQFCENSVACAQAAPWTNEIRSVARYTIGGTNKCTGTLISDVQNQGKRHFFLSANHCLPQGIPVPGSIVVYWNFQSPACGVHGGGSLAQNQIGAVVRALHAAPDFVLFELEDAPDPAFKVFYSGWDRGGIAPLSAVGIHHPNGDEKSISFSSNALTTVNNCLGPNAVANTHWEVVWSSGVTERGSSGSGIWNPGNHRLIGTLSGGNSDCSNPSAPDCYGKFSVAWGIGTNAASRLRDWLDPLNTGTDSVPGFDPGQRFIPTLAPYTISSESCSNNAVDPGETVTIQIPIHNLGPVAGTNTVVTLLVTGGITTASAPQSYGTLAGGETVTRAFTFTTAGNCGQEITPALQVQAGSSNYGVLTYNISLGRTNLALEQSFDGVIPSALPAGWVATVEGAGNPWQTSTALSDSPPNSAFSPNQGSVTDNQLTSPGFLVNTTNAQLMFRHYYNVEDEFDGGVLEISVAGAAFTDFEVAGGSFLVNGYDGALWGGTDGPLGGRSAWTGNSGSFVTTVAQLPSNAAGKIIKLRWRLGSDSTYGNLGWYLDTVRVVDGYNCCTTLAVPTIVNPRVAAGQVAFSFNTMVGQTYAVESSPVLGAGQTWTTVKSIVGNGLVQSYTNTLPGPQRFFRLRAP